MSSRNRLSSARSVGRSSMAPTASRQAAIPAEEPLPEYRKPSHPLNPGAQEQLRAINGRNLGPLKEHNKKAEELITDAAGRINDILRERKEYIARRSKKWERGINLEEKETEERQLAALQVTVDDATEQLETSLRALIDNDMSVQRIDETLEWLRQNAPGQLQQEYTTHITQIQSQRQSQRRRTQDVDGDDDMEASFEQDISQTPGPTPLDGSRPALTGPSEMFSSRMQRKKNEYTSISLTGRYSKNNAYIGFKRLVHDAKYGDTGPTLPHPDTWFTENGTPAPGITNGGADSDDDIVVDRQTISTRCPITFQKFVEPYTSYKCPHTFEKTAILQMIRQSQTRIGGGTSRTGDKAVECPVAGCSQMLTAADLHHDKLLIRKIKRMQDAEAQANEDSDQEDGFSQQPTQRSTQRETSSFEDVKVPTTQPPPMSSIVEDLGEPSDDDDDDE